MAIEFNCPYCTATIRVPDMYAGKQGRCPKCDTRLLVPNIPLPNQPGSINPATPAIPQIETAATTGSSPVVPQMSETGPEAAFAVRPVTTSVVKSRRRSGRRRPSRALVIGLPVICFLILFGVIAVTLTSSLPKLHGELVGRRLEGLMLPQSIIPWGDLGLKEDDRQMLQNGLSTQPESLTSQIMVCRLSADDEGIIVTLSAQPNSQWIAVDVSAEKPLAIWRRKEGPPLNRQRIDELSATAISYARDKLQKLNGVQLAIDAAAVRDKLALNAGGGPLSFAIQAIADSTIYPCAAETPDGTLYFCLPKTVQSFIIQGRTQADGRSGFLGDYTVTISADTITTTTAPVDGDSTMTDEMPEMPDPAVGGDNPDSQGEMSSQEPDDSKKPMMNMDEETMKEMQ